MELTAVFVGLAAASVFVPRLTWLSPPIGPVNDDDDDDDDDVGVGDEEDG
jgi:hypothetical protein